MGGHVSSSVEKPGAGVSAGDVSAVGVGPSDTGAGSGRFIYSETSAVGKAECSGSARPDSSLWATARTTHPATAADMPKLVTDQANSVTRSGGCSKR